LFAIISNPLLFQAGIIQFWLSDLLAKSALEGQRKIKKDVIEKNKGQLTMHNLQPAFYILSVGFLAALLVFLCELLQYKMKKRNTGTAHVD
jgi:hypothetical protein